MGRLAEVLARRKKFEPEGHVVSGRVAEFRLLKLTRAVAGDALVLDGIRLKILKRGVEEKSIWLLPLKMKFFSLSRNIGLAHLQ